MKIETLLADKFCVVSQVEIHALLSSGQAIRPKNYPYPLGFRAGGKDCLVAGGTWTPIMKEPFSLFSHATIIGNLIFTGFHYPGHMDLSHITVTGDLIFSNVRLAGGLFMQKAVVDGNLIITAFSSPTGLRLSMEGIKCLNTDPARPQ